MNKEKRKNVSLDEVREMVKQEMGDANARKEILARNTLLAISRKIMQGKYWIDGGDIKVRLWGHPDWFWYSDSRFLNRHSQEYGFSEVEANDGKFMWPAQVFTVKIKDKR